MKTTSHPAALKAALFAACGFFAASLGLHAQSTSPSIPVGWLTAHPTVVQTGTKPTLTWDISYPSVVKDFVDVIVPATVKSTKNLDVEVRVLGNGVTSGSGGSITFVNAEALLSFNGGSYSRIFYGTNNNVNPKTVVWSRKGMKPNETLRFGGRYFWNNSWGPTFNSTSSTLNVRTLVSGDTPPNKLPVPGAPSLENFIKPYLDKQGKVKIGPMDVIVFMELTHTNEADAGYDLQDMVLLVTFKEVKK